MRQRDAFLRGEGDAWFLRNSAAVSRGVSDDDRIVATLRHISTISEIRRVLEVGCGAGQRSAAIAAASTAKVSGIDPSVAAVSHARKLGVDAQVGTADALPFAAGEFDVVIFGFCLYLCDRDDLFRIAAEAHRVLATPGWLVIHDFFSISPVTRPYHHKEGLWSFKMDYRRLFDWHPSYVCLSHEVYHHLSDKPTDDAHEWVSVSLLRKLSGHD
jgi:SAM-dependent methyltransferase